MIEGWVSVKDEMGNTILSANVWVLIFARIFCGGLHVDPGKVRVFIDGEEIHKPEAYEDDT